MVAMHLSLFEVLANSLGPSVKSILEKTVGVSLDQINEVITELEEPK